MTAIDTKKGTLTRSMDGTQNAISMLRPFHHRQPGRQSEVRGMKHDLLFGVDDEYRKIYREDLIRQKSLSTFSYLNPVYGREVPVPPSARPTVRRPMNCAAIRSSCRARST